MPFNCTKTNKLSDTV